MNLIRIAIASSLMLFAAFIVVMNWAMLFANWRNKRLGVDKFHSPVPVVSVVLAGLAVLLVLPYSWRHWLWLIPAVDYTNWLVVTVLPWQLWRDSRERKPNSGD